MTESYNDKLILEYNLSSHQMIHTSLIGLAILCIAITGVNEISGYLLYIFIIGITILLGIITIITFSRKGFVKVDGKVFKGYFFGKNLLLKKTIDITDKNAFTILKLRKKQKMAFFAAANPDMAQSFDCYDIAFLNKKHTIKEVVLSLKKEKNSKLATEFLSKNTDLKLEIYSPDFS
ncbi:hypothetical protein AB9K26_00695 [Psychroserpens sp. XS_ASV72]|uniref:hypothetical protein n=1 Tax=Psychroserpens sp. XS_ASV72 TaxID=3241293 RepID=UPI0035111405